MPQLRVLHGDDKHSGTVIPLQIKGRAFTAMVLRLTAEGESAFLQALEDKLRQAPNFFRGAPVVLDLEDVASLGRPIDFVRVVAALQQRGMTVVGVQNGTGALDAAAFDAGLAPLKGGRESALPDRPSRVAPPPPPPPSSVVITEPVRSGQQVFAEGGDLVVVASVGAGAELIAEGNIHVYGTLRGRALAGVNGNAAARIFCTRLEAELVAIAGLYKVSDDIDRSLTHQPVQIFLRADVLCIEPLR